MNTQCAGRLLVATIVSAGLVSAVLAADSGAAQTEPQALVSGSAAPAMSRDLSRAPDADANIPNAPEQVFSYYTVSGATMRGRSSSVETAYGNVGCIYMTAGTGLDLIVNSDVPIPDGSLIKYLRIYYDEINPTNGVRALLTRYAPGTQTIDLTSVTSTAAFVAGYGTSLSPEISELVDGDAYAYTVIGWPDVAASTNKICGVRVAYYAPDFFSNGFENPL